MVDQLIELRLSHPNKSALKQKKAAISMQLVEQFLQLVTELPVKAAELGTDEFCAQLNQFRARLNDALSDEEASLIAGECVVFCREYYERASAYLLDRETEFNQLILFLRNAVAELASQSSTFQHRLNDSSERISGLTDIQDIRELKRMLAEEVSHLKTALAEKQKQEEESQQWMNEHIIGLQSKLSQAKAEASHDALTGVANRRSFDDEIKRWVMQRRAHELPFVCAMIDIDNFKAINDTHGHVVGDFVLKCLADFFRKNVRSTDFIARYGGEEFVVLLQNVTLQLAESKMAATLAKLSSETFECQVGDQTTRISFQASCGLAECSMRENQWELIMRADGALYEAKKRGKNQVVTTW